MRTIAGLFVSFGFAQAGELHEAARVCDADRMLQLLSQRPSLNQLDESGMTPLNVAIDSRQTACVRLLLEAGADRNFRDRRGRTAFDAALQAADLGEGRAIVALLWNLKMEKAGAVIEKPTGPMPWSLEYASMHGQSGVMKMLLELGADPNAPGRAGTTPLADAALKGDLDGVTVLLAHGARVDSISQEGTQPIHDAALGGSADVIRELAAHSADVNARTKGEGRTALHIAAAMGRIAAVEALVRLGADLHVKDSHGLTPVDAAERSGMTDVAVFLRQAATGK